MLDHWSVSALIDEVKRGVGHPIPKLLSDVGWSNQVVLAPDQKGAHLQLGQLVSDRLVVRRPSNFQQSQRPWSIIHDFKHLVHELIRRVGRIIERHFSSLADKLPILSLEKARAHRGLVDPGRAGKDERIDELSQNLTVSREETQKRLSEVARAGDKADGTAYCASDPFAAPMTDGGEFKLPPLPYAYDALEPAIGTRIMELHHSKHHNTYVTKLNAALEQHPDLADKPIDELLRGINSVPEQIRTAGDDLRASFRRCLSVS